MRDPPRRAQDPARPRRTRGAGPLGDPDQGGGPGGAPGASPHHVGLAAAPVPRPAARRPPSGLTSCRAQVRARPPTYALPHQPKELTVFRQLATFLSPAIATSPTKPISDVCDACGQDTAIYTVLGSGLVCCRPCRQHHCRRKPLAGPRRVLTAVSEAAVGDGPPRQPWHDHWTETEVRAGLVPASRRPAYPRTRTPPLPFRRPGPQTRDETVRRACNTERPEIPSLANERH